MGIDKLISIPFLGISINQSKTAHRIRFRMRGFFFVLSLEMQSVAYIQQSDKVTAVSILKYFVGSGFFKKFSTVQFTLKIAVRHYFTKLRHMCVHYTSYELFNEYFEIDTMIIMQILVHSNPCGCT